MQISDYLRSTHLIAIKPEARHLVTLVIRKILASSSYAIQGTLATMIGRLQAKQSVIEGLEHLVIHKSASCCKINALPYELLVHRTERS